MKNLESREKLKGENKLHNITKSRPRFCWHFDVVPLGRPSPCPSCWGCNRASQIPDTHSAAKLQPRPSLLAFSKNMTPGYVIAKLPVREQRVDEANLKLCSFC